jgi:hypothetical protein
MSQRKMVAALSARFSWSPRKRLSSASVISASMSERLGGTDVGLLVTGAVGHSPSAQAQARAAHEASALPGGCAD